MPVEIEELKRLFLLSYSVFATSFTWFLYWILYDVIVWNKSLIQVNILNYFGLITMVGLILLQSRIIMKLFRTHK